MAAKHDAADFCKGVFTPEKKESSGLASTGTIANGNSHHLTLTIPG